MVNRRKARFGFFRVEVSEHIVSLPSFIHSAVPELSRVGVEVVVAPTGVVVSAMPVSGSQQWYEKAAALAMTWRFTPFEREGKAAVEDGVAAFGKPPIETDRRADAVWTDTASDRQRTGADHISSTSIAFAVR